MKEIIKYITLFLRLIRIGNHFNVVSVPLAYIAARGGQLEASDFVTILQLIIIFGPLTYGCIYLFNDINDIEYDKRHPEKAKGRILASGEVSKKNAILVLIVWFTLSIVAGYLISPKVSLMQFVFWSISLVYTKWAKHIPYIDILSNALSHMVRSITGLFIAGANLNIFIPFLITHLLMAGYVSAKRRFREYSYVSFDVRPVLRFYSPFKLRFLATLFVICSVLHFFVTINSEALWLRLLYIVFPISILLLSKSHGKLKGILDSWYYGTRIKI